MKKLLLVTALTAFTILGATSAFAQEVPASEKSVQANEAGKRVKRETEYGVRNSSFKTNEVVRKSFDVPEDHGWMKAWVKNDGDANMTVAVERDYDLKQPTFENGSTGVVTVKPGESAVIYSAAPVGTGSHTIQINSSNAVTEGSVSVKYSSDKRQL